MADGASGQSSAGEERQARRELLLGLARAFGGAIFFSLPMLMTMEMWWLGFYIDRVRLAVFTAVFFPLLVALDHYSGFKETSTWGEDALDALVAYGVGVASAVVVLPIFNVINLSMPPREIIGKIIIQAIPASLGAVLAASQLASAGAGREGNEDKQERRKREVGYNGELLFLVAGAFFLAFNLAPTEEMVLIAFKMTPWHTIVLALVTVAMMHAFVYGVEFRGAPSAPEGTPWWSLFLRFTVVGYALALLISAYALWTFGRYEDTALAMYVREAVVLGFPAGLGAAAARVIL